MSGKQIIILVLMLLFLVTTCVTLGLWIRFTTELEENNEVGKARTTRQEGLTRAKNAAGSVVDERDVGLQARLGQAVSEADGQAKKVYGPKEIEEHYKSREAPLKEYWGESGKVAKGWQTFYADIRKEGEEVKKCYAAFNETVKKAREAVDAAEKEMLDALAAEDEKRKEHREKSEKGQRDLQVLRLETEDTLHRITHVIRDLEKASRHEAKGKVLSSLPQYRTVTVDLGWSHGVRNGMKFEVFDKRYETPISKGLIQLTNIRADTSDAVMLAPEEPALYSPVSGWVATEKGMRFDVFSISPEGTDPQPLQLQKGKRDLIAEIRPHRREEPTSELTAGKSERPPIVLSPGFDEISPGDWIANPEFVRNLTDRDFYKQLVAELRSMRELDMEPQVYFFMPHVRANRMEFLKRLIDRNRGRVQEDVVYLKNGDIIHGRATKKDGRTYVAQIGGTLIFKDDLVDKIERDKFCQDVTVIVTTREVMTVEDVELRIRAAPPGKESQDVERWKRVREYLSEGRKFNCTVVAEDMMEDFLARRQRKFEILMGRVTKPGQRAFYIAGSTRYRTVEETGYYIVDKGGKVVANLSEGVDYVVVGAGVDNAQVDKASGRVYYMGETAPPGCVPFYEAAKTMGFRLIREEELPNFFGRPW